MNRKRREWKEVRERGQIRDESALHIPLYQSKQPVHQPRVSLSVCLPVSLFLSLSLSVLLSLPDR